MGNWRWQTIEADVAGAQDTWVTSWRFRWGAGTKCALSLAGLGRRNAGQRELQCTVAGKGERTEEEEEGSRGKRTDRIRQQRSFRLRAWRRITQQWELHRREAEIRQSLLPVLRLFFPLSPSALSLFPLSLRPLPSAPPAPPSKAERTMIRVYPWK